MKIIVGLVLIVGMVFASQENLIKSFEGTSFDFDPQEKFIALGTEDSKVKIWDFKKQDFIKIFSVNESKIHKIKISPNGRFLAAGSFSNSGKNIKTLNIWNLSDGTLWNKYEVSGRGANFNFMNFSPDSKYLIASGANDMVYFFDIQNKQLIKERDIGYKIIFNPVNQEEIVSFSYNGYIKVESLTIHNANLEKKIVFNARPLKWDINSVQYSHDGQYLVSGHGSGRINLINIAKKTYETIFTNNYSVYSVDINNNKSFIVFGTAGGKIKVLDIKNQKILQTFEEDKGKTNTVAFSPSEKYIASRNYSEKLIELWDNSELINIDNEYKQLSEKSDISKYKNLLKKIKDTKYEGIYFFDEVTKKIAKADFQNSNSNNTIASYKKFIKENPNSSQVKEAWKNIYKLVYKEANSKNTVTSYKKFTNEYPKAPQVKEAWQNIYKLEFALVKKENNIVGYEWFIKTYPNAPQVKEAITTMHKLAFAQAKKIHAVSSYDTFIIAYPYAKEVKDALFVSNQLQTNKILGMKQDDEKKARLLAVKIKKMTLRMKGANNKAGYEMVINRMSNLLTEKFEATDASLRYYESKEFTDFVATFKDTMNEVKSILNQISSNTSDISSYTQKLVNVSEQGFADAKADRKMTEYKNQKHREWEKFMHYKDRGY